MRHAMDDSAREASDAMAQKSALEVEVSKLRLELLDAKAASHDRSVSQGVGRGSPQVSAAVTMNPVRHTPRDHSTDEVSPARRSRPGSPAARPTRGVSPQPGAGPMRDNRYGSPRAQRRQRPVSPYLREQMADSSETSDGDSPEVAVLTPSNTPPRAPSYQQTGPQAMAEPGSPGVAAKWRDTPPTLPLAMRDAITGSLGQFSPRLSRIPPPRLPSARPNTALGVSHRREASPLQNNSPRRSPRVNSPRIRDMAGHIESDDLNTTDRLDGLDHLQEGRLMDRASNAFGTVV